MTGALKFKVLPQPLELEKGLAPWLRLEAEAWLRLEAEVWSEWARFLE